MLMNTYHYICTPELMQMLKHFYLISGLRVGIHDPDMNIVSEYPTKPSAYENLVFCDKMRYHSAAYTEKCRKCDCNAFAHVRMTKKAYIYTCHAGFTEALIPILHGDRIVCALMIGQVRGAGITDATFDKLASIHLPQGLTEEGWLTIRQSFEHASSIEQAVFESYVFFLELCAQSIFENRYIRIEEKSITENFKDYVHKNIYNTVTIWDAAAALNISVSHLSRLLSRDLGMSFTEYVTSQKIDVAKELLLSSDFAVADIAGLLKFNDPTYFMRVFKKQVGMTCTAFRRSHLQK